MRRLHKAEDFGAESDQTGDNTYINFDQICTVAQQGRYVTFGFGAQGWAVQWTFPTEEAALAFLEA